jgi:hypothetical protein
LEKAKEEAWMKGQRVHADAEIAMVTAKDADEAEFSKKAAYAIFEKALGVNAKALMKHNAFSTALRAIPKIMFLSIVVGCELDLMGFFMSFSSYWTLDILPLKVLLIMGPVGYVVAIAMFMCLKNSGDSDTINDHAHSVLPTSNPLRPSRIEDLSTVKQKRAWTMMIKDTKEPIALKFYHFMPIIRYYLIIKDANPSDVEGLFRVNSLSSFTLGVSQICGILFTNVGGAPMDIFVKINIASQVINWLITLLYFATSVSNRMKASFKVDTLFYNSAMSLRKEYESYLNVTEESSRNGGGEKWAEEIERFHISVNTEISEFVRQELDLTMFTMGEKFKMRQAIRKRMYATYMTIQ